MIVIAVDSGPTLATGGCRSRRTIRGWITQPVPRTTLRRASRGSAAVAAARPPDPRLHRRGHLDRVRHPRLSRPERRLEDHRPAALHDRELRQRSSGARRALAGAPGGALLERRAEPGSPGGHAAPAGGARAGGGHPEHRRPPPEGGHGERHRAARHVRGGDLSRLQAAHADRRRARPGSRGRRGSALRGLWWAAQDRHDQLRPAAGRGRHGSRAVEEARAVRRLPRDRLDAVRLARCGRFQWRRSAVARGS